MRVSAPLSDTSHRRRSSGSLDLMPDGSVGLMIERLFGVLTRAPCGGPKECPHFTSPDNGRKIEGVPCLWEGAQPRPLVREEFPVDWFSPFGSPNLWILPILVRSGPFGHASRAKTSPSKSRLDWTCLPIVVQSRISAETKQVNSVLFSERI